MAIRAAKAWTSACIAGCPAIENDRLARDVPVDAERGKIAAASGDLLMIAEGRHLLLPEGTSAVQEYYRITYEAMRSNETVLAWYGRFEPINDQFIKQVSEWQSTDGDERIQSRLIKTVERLSKYLQEITPLIPRYENYLNRFGASVAKIDEGQKEFICTPTIDSVHNIWFEFHEDILSVIGRPRDT